MISKNVILFLKELESNNNREWFQENKAKYEASKSEVETIINELIPLVQQFDTSIGAPLVKDCMFRIYRDVRFSPDKSPYKTHIGAFIANGGRKSRFGGYYLHLEAGKSMLGGGIYRPSPDEVKKIRQAMHYHAADFESILQAPKFKEYFECISDDQPLQKPHRDCPEGFAHPEWFTYRNFTVLHRLNDDEVSKTDFIQKATDVFEAMAPFNRFLNDAISF